MNVTLESSTNFLYSNVFSQRANREAETEVGRHRFLPVQQHFHGSVRLLHHRTSQVHGHQSAAQRHRSDPLSAAGSAVESECFAYLHAGCWNTVARRAEFHHCRMGQTL